MWVPDLPGMKAPNGWNGIAKVLAGLGDMIKYLSIHSYWENASDYYSFIGQSAMIFEHRIKLTADQIDIARAMKGFKNPVYISVR